MKECKGPEAAITQEVFDQAARYNLSLNVSVFLITNGINTFVCRADAGGRSYEFLQEIPPQSKVFNVSADLHSFLTGIS
ncbi:MAG: type I restriction enzyme HsdR N-terminal domain-containing protein [Bacteroidia bacterium]